MRLRPVRHGSAILLVLCALLFGLLPPEVHALDMDVLVGFGQSVTSGARYRPDTWTPITVYLTGPSARGTGQLQITLDHGGRATTYTRRVTLRDGMMNQAEGFVLNLHNTEMYGQMQTRDLEIQLLADGRKLASKKMALPGPIDPGAYTVLAMTRDNSGLNFLTKKRLGLTHRHTNPATLANSRMGWNNGNNGDTSEHNGIDPNATLQLLYTDARALPPMPQGYEAIDAIALADQPLDSLTDAQTAAIKTYVRQGGLLIVSGGGDLARLKSQFFADLLPLVPQSVASAQSLPTLETRYRSSLGLSVPTALTSGTLARGASVLLAGPTPSTPLVTMRPYGAGRVVFTAFDYVDPTFRGWNAITPLWRDLLRTGNEAISPREVLDSATTFGGSAQRMVDALAGKQASSFPHWGVLTGFLFTYILLLLPINYLILKRYDRRELGWISIPILIVIFVLTSYFIALSIKGGALSANRVVVVETQVGSGQAAGYGQMTLYSPRRTAYDISIASDSVTDAQAFSLRDAIGYAGGSVRDLTLDSTSGDSSIRGALIRLWDKRSFDTPLNISLGKGIEAQTRMTANNQVEVIVTNQTPYPLVHCSLLADDQHVELGDLSPGQSSPPKTMTWGMRQNATNIPFASLPNSLPLSNNTGEDARHRFVTASTHDKMVMALGDTLTQGWDSGQYGNYGESGHGYGRSLNAFVGWFDASLMTPRINGKPAPQGEEVNLLFAHLPAPANATPKIRALANPFEQKPVLNLEDQLPPGARKAGRNG